MIWTIISLSVGIFGILVPIWKASRNYRLSYTEHVKRLFLFKQDGDLEISVSYKGETCSSPLIMASLCFKNDGNKDIVFKQKYTKPIKINSSLINIINATCSQSNHEVNPLMNEVDGAILLSWDILKKNESINIDILGSVNNLTSINQLQGCCFNVSSRAADIKEVSHKKKINQSKLLMIAAITYTLFILLCTSLFSGGMRDVSLIGDISYRGETINDAAILYNAYTDKYYITTPTKRVVKYLPLDDISDIIVTNSKLPSKHYRAVNLCIIIAVLIATIILYICIVIKIINYPSYIREQFILE